MNWEQIIVLTFITICLIVMGGAIFMVWFEEIIAPFKRLFKRKPKYKVGQKVRVKNDLINGEVYNKRRFYSSMVKHVGSVVTIDYIDEESQYMQIKEDDEDTWVADMFEPVKIKKEDAFEALLHGHINDEEYTKIMKRRRRC